MEMSAPVVDAFHRPVRHPGVEIRQDALGVLSNRAAQLHERLQTGPHRPPERAGATESGMGLAGRPNWRGY